MVGKKFFMAVVREFQDLCRLLSCQNVQSSPKHSVPCVERRKSNISSLSPIKEEEDEDVSDIMGNRPPKVTELSHCDASAYQEHVLNILRQEKAPLKESHFSPYTPLPAIGKSNCETTEPYCSDSETTKPYVSIRFETTNLHRKIERQQTYRVLEPVYVKGPYDLYKFPSAKSKVVVEGGVLKRNIVCNSDGNPRSNTLLKINESDMKPKINHVKFSNSMGTRTKQPTRNFLKDKENLKQSNVNKENTAAFWIDF